MYFSDVFDIPIVNLLVTLQNGFQAVADEFEILNWFEKIQKKKKSKNQKSFPRLYLQVKHVLQARNKPQSTRGSWMIFPLRMELCLRMNSAVLPGAAISGWLSFYQLQPLSHRTVTFRGEAQSPFPS